MKKVKYKDYRIGEYLFTVRICDCGINCLGHREFDYEVYEQHPHPTNWLKEFFNSKTVYRRGMWFSSFSDTLEGDIISTCTTIAKELDNLKKAEKMWKEF
jgi:hypothetical protein